MKLLCYNLIYVFYFLKDNTQINFNKDEQPKCSVEQIRRTIVDARRFIISERYGRTTYGLLKEATTGNYFYNKIIVDFKLRVVTAGMIVTKLWLRRGGDFHKANKMLDEIHPNAYASSSTSSAILAGYNRYSCGLSSL